MITFQDLPNLQECLSDDGYLVSFRFYTDVWVKYYRSKLRRFLCDSNIVTYETLSLYLDSRATVESIDAINALLQRNFEYIHMPVDNSTNFFKMNLWCDQNYIWAVFFNQYWYFLDSKDMSMFLLRWRQ